MAHPEYGAHNAAQIEYFGTAEKPGMRPASTPFHRRHLERLMRDANLAAGARVLEIGAGMGRYTFQLVERAFEVHAVDLSQRLLDRLKEHDSDDRVTTYCADVVDLPPEMDGTFDAVIGLFMLHHVHDLQSIFDASRRLAKVGGFVGFVEPNPYCPLFYVQIAVTPGMSWKAERGMRLIRPSIIAPMVQTAGLEEVALTRFGLFPPFAANNPVGRLVERVLEWMPPVRPMRAFTAIRARRRR